MAANTQFKKDFLAKLDHLFEGAKLTNPVRREMLDAFDKVLAEQHRNVRHQAAEKLDEVWGEHMGQVATLRNTEAVFNQMTGAVMNLRPLPE